MTHWLAEGVCLAVIAYTVAALCRIGYRAWEQALRARVEWELLTQTDADARARSRRAGVSPCGKAEALIARPVGASPATTLAVLESRHGVRFPVATVEEHRRLLAELAEIERL